MGALLGGTSHVCDSRCDAPNGEDHLYFIFCSCTDGCKSCEEGKIYFYECPYKLIDHDVILFNKLYKAHKNGIFTYGAYLDMPQVLIDYFDLLDNQIDRWQSEKKKSFDKAEQLKTTIEKMQVENGR